MSSAKRPVAIVTGGWRGIGLGIAKCLATGGFDIALTGPGDGDAAMEGLLDDFGREGARAIYVKSDLTDLAGHQAAVGAIVSELGPVSCLVNNAGIGSVMRGDFLDLRPENFDAIMGVNLRGTVFFTQAVVRSMLNANVSDRPRSVINITSVSAAMSSPERLDYCMTKAGLAAFTQGLTLRLAETGIAVFEVRPGIIRSDMTAKVAEKYDALIGEGVVPAKRWGEPADVGNVVAALASGAFGFATGSVINVDGALSIDRL